MVYDPYARNSSAGAANEAQQVTANPEDLRNYQQRDARGAPLRRFASAGQR
jgi:hypothetical protein